MGNSISALAFFGGRLYAADYSKKCIWFFENDDEGRPDMGKPIIIAEGSGAEIVDLVGLLVRLAYIVKLEMDWDRDRTGAGRGRGRGTEMRMVKTAIWIWTGYGYRR